MPKRREVDIIDVNQLWGAWSGSRRYGYLLGTVRAHDRLAALAAARAAFPGTRYVEARHG